MKSPQLSRSEFNTFLLIYAAHVDYQYSEQEINYIKTVCGTQDYDSMYALFNSVSDYSSLKTIMKYKDRYFVDPNERSYIQNQIIEVFKADGDYSRPERIFLQFLEKLSIS